MKKFINKVFRKVNRPSLTNSHANGIVAHILNAEQGSTARIKKVRT